jgi:hypothetical protein
MSSWLIDYLRILVALFQKTLQYEHIERGTKTLGNHMSLIRYEITMVLVS